MINLKEFTVNPFQEKTYLLSDATGKCLIVDPGMNNEHEEQTFARYIEENGLVPEAVINTHCHTDHLLGVSFVMERYKIPFFFHAEEAFILQHAEEYGAYFGLKLKTPPTPEKFLEDGEIFYFGESALKLLHVPGHSPGSLAFYAKDDQFILTGDVLFKSSIGRTDLPGGDYATIMSSIQNKLMVLPGDTKVFPGHGSSTTIGQEHDTNPFLK
ncbi:MAG: MBL fold metallo-hydrolase [Bacteroidales bacterium]|nr:MBL fold metallo-hydrolase [Bacteroidales bacterium]